MALIALAATVGGAPPAYAQEPAEPTAANIPLYVEPTSRPGIDVAHRVALQALAATPTSGAAGAVLARARVGLSDAAAIGIDILSGFSSDGAAAGPVGIWGRYQAYRHEGADTSMVLSLGLGLALPTTERLGAAGLAAARLARAAVDLSFLGDASRFAAAPEMSIALATSHASALLGAAIDLGAGLRGGTSAALLYFLATGVRPHASFWVLFEVHGRVDLDAAAAERSLLSLGASLRYEGRRIQPAIGARIPIGSLRDLVKLIGVAELAVTF